MEECSFAPVIYTKKRVKTAMVGSRQQAAAHDLNQGVIEEQNEGTDEYYLEDEEDVRDIDTFVADQNRFLQQKQAKEELRKAKLLEEELRMKERAPKMARKSVQILK